jgi:hypothetical protein
VKRAGLLALLSTLAALHQAGAQDALAVRAVRRDTMTAGATVTAAFMATNARDDSVRITARLELPNDWSALTGAAPFPVAGRSTEMLMLSIAVPARTAAGVYPVRVWLTSTEDPRGVMDSVVVRVPARRALDVDLLDRPGFAVSGNSYDASFLVRNRGNIAATVELRIKSSLGSLAVQDTTLRLEAEESRVVRTTVRSRAGLQSAIDDVLEMYATQHGSSEAEGAHASARVMIVPEPTRKIEEFLRIPTQVNIRAASAEGVSPFEVFGEGKVIDGGATDISFLFRGPTGKYSVFGERDEYRVELRAPSWRARLGDQLYMLSSLTGAGQPGFGAGADATRGMFTAGAYGQQFRRVAEKGTEQGAFLSVRPREDARAAVNLVNRVGGSLAGQIASAEASLEGDAISAGLELARSRHDGSDGLARSARVSGARSGLSYDFGHFQADTGFAGSQRGASHNYLTANAHPWSALSFGVNGSKHRSDLSRATGVPYIDRLDLASLSATAFGRYTLEVGAVSRGTTIQSLTQSGRQNSVRARGDHDFAFGTLTVEGEAGRAKDVLSEQRLFTDVSLGARRAFQRGQVAAYVERYSGGSIIKGTERVITVGGDAGLRLNRFTQLSLIGYAMRLQSANSPWHSQIEALLTHGLRNGNSVTLRARLMGGSSLSAAEQSVAYLEYGIPLRLPVSRLRTPGRVFGRVVDAVSGQGVPGALVRLGPQVAITDQSGQVAFGGVPGGEHRLSMSQETSFANAVFVGDPTLVVDSTRARPTTFTLAIARSARLDVDVRRFVAVRTAVAGAPDSLVESGALANATLVLAGETDTLYRTTSASGKASFTDVPPGRWMVTVRGDAPAFHRFEPDRMELELAPGETQALAFRLVPRKREVQLIGEGQELRPTAVDPKGPVKAGTTKTGKPDDRKQDHQ